ncbi:hypothetical protein GGI20_004297 [Coemansia sp. BCRC 34301]|nr:hypothetical protein GGI20_004297 [Coemansia sp. BCRC 34301]
MSDTTPSNEKQFVVHQNLKKVVNASIQVSGLTQLRELIGEKCAILLLHNDSFMLEDNFFNQCDMYLDNVYHADMKVAWCSYAEFATEYKTEHENGELRFAMVTSDSAKYFGVTSGREFAATVIKAFREYLAFDPTSGPYGRVRCMCCYNNTSCRKGKIAGGQKGGFKLTAKKDPFKIHNDSKVAYEQQVALGLSPTLKAAHIAEKSDTQEQEKEPVD